MSTSRPASGQKGAMFGSFRGSPIIMPGAMKMESAKSGGRIVLGEWR